MSNDLVILEEIDQFLVGKLKGEDLANFENRVASDAAFAEMVEVQRIANQIVLTKHLAHLKEKMENDLRPRKAGGNWWKWSPLIGVALVGFLMIDRYNSEPKKEIVATNNSAGEVQRVEPRTVVADAENNKQKEIKRTNSNPLLNTEPRQQSINEARENNLAIHQIEKNIQQDALNEGRNEERMVSVVPNATKPDCSQKKWSVDIQTTPACQGKEEGEILVFDKLPNRYSLDEGHTFSAKKEFRKLPAKLYTLLIVDNDGCSKSEHVEVKEKRCKDVHEVVLNPHLGTWKIPLKENSQAEIHVFDKSGKLVFQKQLASSVEEEWDGKNNEGQLLPPGYYAFTIEYTDGDVQRGFISIMY